MNSSKDSTMPEFTEKLDITETNDLFKLTTNEAINLTSGSVVKFRGIKEQSKDQSARLKSLTGVTTWVLDEAEEETNEARFDKIDLSIRKLGTQNRVVIIMNPATKAHWIYKRFFEDAGVKPGSNITVGDTTYIHTTYLDNIQNLSEGYIAQLEKIRTVNPLKFEHIVMGGWLDKAEGVIFTNWEEGEFDESLPSIFGQDYGFSVDPTTLVEVAVDESKKIVYIREHLYRTGLSTSEIGEVNKQIADRKLIVGDSAEPRLIKELGKWCNIRPAKKPKGSVTGTINKLQDYKLVVEGVNVVKELNNYTWVAGKDSVPIDMYNHALDAVRYAFDALNKGKVWLG